MLGQTCHQNSTCVNLPGSFTCTCNSGYFGDGFTCAEGSCTDDICSLNEECVAPTKLDCQCKEGLNRNEDDICVDIDECFANRDGCDEEADCLNTEGSYNCECREGFHGDGLTCLGGSCPDSNCPENQKCISPTTVGCECMAGFTWTNSTTCADIDECEAGPCGKDKSCINTIGSFECSEWILVLSTSSSLNGSLMIDGHGHVKKIGFDLETEVIGSCSLAWRGKMYIFGGNTYKRQISVVDQCSLKMKGELSFDMVYGACAQRNTDELFICFENRYVGATYKTCRLSNGPFGNFSQVPSSIYDHVEIQIAATPGKLQIVIF